jgi:hypothetical protein
MQADAISETLCFLVIWNSGRRPKSRDPVTLSVAYHRQDSLGSAWQYTVDSRLSARGLTALRLNRGNVFLKKKFYFP